MRGSESERGSERPSRVEAELGEGRRGEGMAFDCGTVCKLAVMQMQEKICAYREEGLPVYIAVLCSKTTGSFSL